MLSLIIADKSFSTRERSMLSRLEVGLADEGVRVVHAAPRDVPIDQMQSEGLQSTIVPYEESSLPFRWRPSRHALHLLRAITLADGEAPEIDIVHAFGASCWTLAVEVARLSNAALLLEVYRPSLVSAAAGRYAAIDRHQSAPMFLTSEPAIASALAKSIPQARVISAPWGVHAPPAARTAASLDQPLSLAILFDTGESKPVAACLGGIVAAGPCLSESMIEMSISDASSSREARVWSAARKAGLLDRVSILPDMESRREPVLEMDLLLLPEPGGWERTFVLEAMARGVGVIAAADSTLDYLEDSTTARLVRGDTPAAWAAAIRELAENPRRLADLRAAAHNYIRTHRAPSTHIEAVIKAYRMVARPEPAPTA
jgi:hypothetical protein